MTWKSVTAKDRALFRQIMLWIRTARAAGEKFGLDYYGSDWLPSEPDFHKSALFERIRNGLEPMDEPPPVGYSCPWYALVEDAGPHYVYDVHFYGQFIGEDCVSVAQNIFKIYERISETELIVGDKRGTSYRFRLWFDPKWEHPTAYHKGEGGWLMQNVALASGIETRRAKTAQTGFVGTMSTRSAKPRRPNLVQGVQIMDEVRRDGRDSDPTKSGIFRDHNCWKCNDGEKPCARKDGHSHLCEYPHARND